RRMPWRIPRSLVRAALCATLRKVSSPSIKCMQDRKAGESPGSSVMPRLLVALAFGAACFAQESAKPAAPAYVGSEICQSCHEDIAKAFGKNPHQVLEINPKRGWKEKGCE